MCGKLFSQATHCTAHKNTNDFIKCRQYPRCKGDSKCKERPVYSSGTYPERCEAHHLETDTNVIEKPCSSCGLSYFIPITLTTCINCSEFIKIRAARQKYKEETIAGVFTKANIPCVHDRIPAGSCNKYRPDFIIDCATHFVIVEVDENQHSNYECECEQRRMINIAQDVGGGLPVRFIRYNPDKYKDHAGKAKTGNPSSRHTKLLEVVAACRQHVPDRPISAIYLFYDGYDANKLEIMNINLFEPTGVTTTPAEPPKLNDADPTDPALTLAQ